MNEGVLSGSLLLFSVYDEDMDHTRHCYLPFSFPPEIADENCLLTLREMNRELRRRLPAKPQVHNSTAGEALDNMLIRIKLARPLPADRNRLDVIRRRVEYANWFMTNGILHHCVFIDECGYKKPWAN